MIDYNTIDQELFRLQLFWIVVSQKAKRKFPYNLVSEATVTVDKNILSVLLNK